MSEQSKTFEILSTLRYDSNLTDVKKVHVFDNKYLWKIHSSYDKYQLDMNDGGYNFPDKPSIPNVKTLTTINETHHKTNPSIATATDITINPFDVENWPSDIVSNLTDVLLQRFLFLPQHYSRIRYALKFFKISSELSYQSLTDLLINTIPIEGMHIISRNRRLLNLIENPPQTFKIRILVNEQGKARAEAHPIQLGNPAINYFEENILAGFMESPKDTWDIFMNEAPIVTSQFTTFKTTSRDHYSVARKLLMDKVGAYRNNEDETKCEILLYNENDFITEGSITNIAIIRGVGQSRKYITPKLNSGCLCGIMRYYLLSQGFISEGDISKDELKTGDTILLFNGVMGCVKGILRD